MGLCQWTKCSDALPIECGLYLVYRGHWYAGKMRRGIGVSSFNPKENIWGSQGYEYTHWFGPLCRPISNDILPVLYKDLYRGEE